MTNLQAADKSDPARLESAYSFDETIERLRSAFASKGLRIFAEIDHADAAKTAGLDMPPTKVLVYGNPAAGTPLMQEAPDLALELPLRVLVRQEAPPKGPVFVVFHRAGFVVEGHTLSEGKEKVLAGAETLIANTVGAKP